MNDATNQITAARAIAKAVQLSDFTAAREVWASLDEDTRFAVLFHLARWSAEVIPDPLAG
jgi:hypothetical protein